MENAHATQLCRLAVGVLGVLVLCTSGCTSLREVASLRKVQFEIDRVTQARLAGVDLSGIRSYEDLTTQQALRLGASLADGTLPLSFTLHLQATNPSSNDVNARITEMDWTLLLEEKETVSGTFDQEVVLPPGEPTSVDFQIDLDLVRFFDDNVRGLLDLASAIGGEGPPQRVALRIQPTIETRLGRFQYPSPITVSRDVGQKEQN